MATTSHSKVSKLSLYEFLRVTDAQKVVGSELADVAATVVAHESAPRDGNAKLIDFMLRRLNVDGRVVERVLRAWKAARECER